MQTALKTIPQTMKSKTPTPLWQRDDKLNGLLLGPDSPIVGPKTAAQLRAVIAEPEPELPEQAQVEVMIGKLAIATAQPKTSQAEAEERVEMYWLALRDIPLDDLRLAFADLVKTKTFLPVPAEARAAAMKYQAVRLYAKSRARSLLTLHEREWTEPAEQVKPEELQALMAELRVGNVP